MWGKDILSRLRSVALLNNAASVNGAGNVGTQAQLDTPYWGNLVVIVNKGGAGLTAFGVYTSYLTGFAPGTTNVCTIKQDTVNSTGVLTITSNTFAVATSGIYTFSVANLQEFVNVMYTAADTSSTITAFLVAELAQIPFNTANDSNEKSAY